MSSHADAAPASSAPIDTFTGTTPITSGDETPVQRRARRVLTAVTAAWVFVQLLSLRLNLLDRFFFDTLHADVQAIDFFSLPKAWLNLQSGRSLYATFDPPAYGPHLTWYLSHPLLAVVLGGPLSRLAPMDSYGVYTLLSLAIMAGSAALFARQISSRLQRASLYLLLLGSFPGYLMLWVGNVQALTVLGITLLLVGLLRLSRSQDHAATFVRAGLLVCLFTKPVVLVVLPLLLLLRETRRCTLQSLAVYLPVSLACEFLPLLNPQSITPSRLAWLASHPGFVRGTMNIYRNGLQLTPDMRDNSIHWFNLVAQSGFRLQHVDIYSLAVFLDNLLDTRTPGWLYLLPTLLVLGLSLAVARMPDPPRRLHAALLLAAAALLSFFLVYPTVWEYQYTAILPIAATLFLAGPGELLGRQRWRMCVVLAVCAAWLPSLYFLSGSATPTPATLTLARLDRVVPVTWLFALLSWVLLRASFLRRGSATPGKPVS